MLLKVERKRELIQVVLPASLLTRKQAESLAFQLETELYDMEVTGELNHEFNQETVHHHA